MAEQDAWQDVDWARYPAKGSLISYSRKKGWRGEREHGVGIVDSIWIGIEPVVTLMSGVHLHLDCGDTWEPATEVVDG